VSLSFTASDFVVPMRIGDKIRVTNLASQYYGFEGEVVSDRLTDSNIPSEARGRGPVRLVKWNLPGNIIDSVPLPEVDMEAC